MTVKTIIFSVRSQKETIADMKTGWKSGVRQETAQFSFATSELMSKVLTEKRWEILKALCGAGPVTFRKAAELVGRDVKGVHADLTALIKAGVVDRESDGVIFPYDTIEVDYELTRSLPSWLSQAAAAKLRSDALGAAVIARAQAEAELEKIEAAYICEMNGETINHDRLLIEARNALKSIVELLSV